MKYFCSDIRELYQYLQQMLAHEAIPPRLLDRFVIKLLEEELFLIFGAYTSNPRITPASFSKIHNRITAESPLILSRVIKRALPIDRLQVREIERLDIKDYILTVEYNV